MKRGTKHSRVFILFAFYLISTALSFAKEIYFQPIHLEESLTQPSALSIFQDAQGAIWFGNDKLNCYDGHIIRTLRISSYLEQIEDDNIHALCGDGKGLIYLLADNHLLIYHLRQDRFEDTGIQARTLFFAQDTLYYTSGNRLFSYAASGASHEIHTLPESQSTIRCLLRKNGEWLIGASDGLYSLKGNHCQRLSNAANINCIFIDNRQRLWIGSATSGVYVEERGTWLHFKEGNPQYPLINNQVRCINQDEQGNIWIGTYQGLTVADSTLRSISHHTHHESLPYSLPNASVYDIQRDNQGGMWFATYYGGLSYFNPDV